MPQYSAQIERQGSEEKPVAFSILMNVDGLLDLEIEIPWAMAKEIATTILSIMEKREREAKGQKK